MLSLVNQLIPWDVSSSNVLFLGSWTALVLQTTSTYFLKNTTQLHFLAPRILLTGGHTFASGLLRPFEASQVIPSPGAMAGMAVALRGGDTPAAGAGSAACAVLLPKQ